MVFIMFNPNKFDAGECSFLPSGSFDSRKDSDTIGSGEIKENSKSCFLSSSDDLILNSFSSYIVYEERPTSIMKLEDFGKLYDVDQLANCLAAGKNNKKSQSYCFLEKIQHSKSNDFTLRDIEEGYSEELMKLSKELMKTTEENSDLRRELETYKEHFEEYQKFTIYLKSFLSTFQSFLNETLENPPEINETSIKSTLSSMQSMLSQISNSFIEKNSKKCTHKCKFIRASRPDCTKEKITPLASPEPPKSIITLIKRQNCSLIRFDKNLLQKDLKKNSKRKISENPTTKQLNLKSVSPILKLKNKTLYKK